MTPTVLDRVVLVDHPLIAHKLTYLRDETTETKRFRELVAEIATLYHETLEPVQYYAKVPSRLDERMVLVLDPMLATGGSATHAITLLKEQGANNIKLLSIVAAPQGIAAVHEKHPEVPIIVAAIDRCLNDIGYILPGLGDAGDRLFGTR